MTPANAQRRAVLLLTAGLLTLVLSLVLGTFWKADAAAGFLLGLAVVCLIAGLILVARGGGWRTGA
ncbi:hypothetical protein DAETH_13960 [Deinococcus aetherius]|uniref:Uncharacterized protein n=1 Tax=Deinococcus aetherius TaxID=200252 RepID=A0ABN6RDJ0_9DEIO|nr:hypothetical protein [Deinococcus aetherius]BDP41427.1 hypothetical protein DAETH_13960 [Deinococcus aetherius]